MANVDTDINNYNFKELMELLNVSNKGFSKRELDFEYKKRLEINKEIEDKDLKENLEKFFKDVYNFLIKHSLDFKNEVNESNNYFMEDIDKKLNYLVDFNYKSNPENLSNVLSIDNVNQSNIPLNPRTYNIIKKQISINSEFRKKSVNKIYQKGGSNKDNSVSENPLPLFSDTSTDFTIELPEIMDNVISMELVSTEIPNLVNTFSIRKGNYQFKINIRNSENMGNYEITNIYIPTGVWIVSDFVEFLSMNYFDFDIIENNNLKNELLRYLKFEIPSWSAKPVFRFKTIEEINEFNINSGTNNKLESNILKKLEYSIENILHEYLCKNSEKQFYTYKNGNENKINFGLTCLGTLGFDIDQVLDKGSELGNLAKPIIIKYDENNYIYPLNTSRIYYYGYLQALKVYAYSAETAFYICVNDYIGNQGQQILLLGYNKTLTADNILARIAVKHQPFQQNIYNSMLDYSIKREYFGGVRIRKLNIQVIDKYGRIIDISDFPTNFVFEFTIQYSSERLANFRNKI